MGYIKNGGICDVSSAIFDGEPPLHHCSPGRSASPTQSSRPEHRLALSHHNQSVDCPPRLAISSADPDPTLRHSPFKLLHKLVEAHPDLPKMGIITDSPQWKFLVLDHHCSMRARSLTCLGVMRRCLGLIWKSRCADCLFPAEIAGRLVASWVIAFHIDMCLAAATVHSTTGHVCGVGVCSDMCLTSMSKPRLLSIMA